MHNTMEMLVNTSLKNEMPPGDRGAVVSYTRRAPDVSLLTLLEIAPASQRVFWENDATEVAFAGYGVEVELFAAGHERFRVIQERVARLFAEVVIDSDAPDIAGPRVFGGFAFRADYEPDDIWAAFPSAYFILPRYQLTRIHTPAGAENWLTVNHRAVDGDVADSLNDAREEHERLCRRLQLHRSKRKQAAVRGFHYPLAQDAWRAQITDATDRIKAGDMDKVVLSRTAEVTFSRVVDPIVALEKLQTNYPNCYRFLLEVMPGNAFFGATPELLIERKGMTLHTMGLAGSRKRGRNDSEDAAIAQDLMDSAKDRHEHALVIDALREILQPFTRTLDIPDAPSIYRLRNIQHLYTPIRAELNQPRDILEFVDKLHPTPALGGTPRDTAIEAIQRIETVSRGWYAAPVGWIDRHGDGMFAVAIRSAVSSGERARLYAGAGIVADSEPDKEWDETGWKFKPLLDALGVSHVRRESK